MSVYVVEGAGIAPAPRRRPEAAAPEGTPDGRHTTINGPQLPFRAGYLPWSLQGQATVLLDVDVGPVVVQRLRVRRTGPQEHALDVLLPAPVDRLLSDHCPGAVIERLARGFDVELRALA